MFIEKYQVENINQIYKDYEDHFWAVSLFDVEDLLQEYELYKLEKEIDNCFDYFIKFSKCLNKAPNFF